MFIRKDFLISPHLSLGTTCSSSSLAQSHLSSCATPHHLFCLHPKPTAAGANVPAPLHACAVTPHGPVNLASGDPLLKHAHSPLLFRPSPRVSPAGLVLSPSPIHSGSGGCCLGPFGMAVAVMATQAEPCAISVSDSVGLRMGRDLHAGAAGPTRRTCAAFPSRGRSCGPVRAWSAVTGRGRRLPAPGSQAEL